LPPDEPEDQRHSVIRDTARRAAHRSGGEVPRARRPSKRAPKRAPEAAEPSPDAATPAARDPLGDGEGWDAETAFDADRTLGEWLEDIIPPDAQAHFINAGREFAAGVQITVDHHLGRDREARHRPTRIEIE
jgi:hypothetical protein